MDNGNIIDKTLEYIVYDFSNPLICSFKILVERYLIKRFTTSYDFINTEFALTIQIDGGIYKGIF